jgi:hypothetical protein
LAERDNINTLLKTGYDLLGVYSPRNDGLLLISDQLIPGGTLLGYANADHWSVVLPLEIKIPDIRNGSGTTTISPQGVAAGIDCLCG